MTTRWLFPAEFKADQSQGSIAPSDPAYDDLFKRCAIAIAYAQHNGWSLIAQARCAVDAVRHPTPAMLAAAAPAILAAAEACTQHGGQIVEEAARVIWQAMINAAIAEGIAKAQAEPSGAEKGSERS